MCDRQDVIFLFKKLQTDAVLVEIYSKNRLKKGASPIDETVKR